MVKPRIEFPLVEVAWRSIDERDIIPALAGHAIHGGRFKSGDSMYTEILKLDPRAPDPRIIARAAELLCAGELAAFPTETVYGLGGLALDPAAVERIFAAKGRPASNPVIVHVPDELSARELVLDWTVAADVLTRRFWPGPLTIVLRKNARVPEIVTAGGPTVALRAPDHPIALALLRAVGAPLAAPSANRSTRVSPTRAEHVMESLRGRIPLILDGGPCEIGLESTVVDLSVDPPRILRPGMLTADDLESALGHAIDRTGERNAELSVAKSPGMMDRHYAPRAILELVERGAEARVREIIQAGARVGWLALDSEHDRPIADCVMIAMPSSPRAYAAALYDALHSLDAAGVDRIVVGQLPDGEPWRAIRDRLTRAARD